MISARGLLHYCPRSVSIGTDRDPVEPYAEPPKQVCAFDVGKEITFVLLNPRAPRAITANAPSPNAIRCVPICWIGMGVCAIAAAREADCVRISFRHSEPRNS